MQEPLVRRLWNLDSSEAASAWKAADSGFGLGVSFGFRCVGFRKMIA